MRGHGQPIRNLANLGSDLKGHLIMLDQILIDLQIKFELSGIKFNYNFIPNLVIDWMPLLIREFLHFTSFLIKI